MSAHLESRLREILREQRRGQVMDVERSCVDAVTAGVELNAARTEFVEGRARLRAVAETLEPGA